MCTPTKFNPITKPIIDSPPKSPPINITLKRLLNFYKKKYSKNIQTYSKYAYIIFIFDKCFEMFTFIDYPRWLHLSIHFKLLKIR